MAIATLDVSVIICAYTEARWSDLIAAAESVQRQSAPPRKVVIVDHNPALLACAREHLPEVVKVKNKGMPGDSEARNSSVAIAHGSLIAFLDDNAIDEINTNKGLT